MITNAMHAQRIYDGRWRDLDGDPSTGVAGREFCLKALEPGSPVFWRDPCDSLTQVVRTIKQTYCIPQNYVDNDCNCCTPLPLGPTSAGSEALVHWVGTVAPPRPTTNLEPDDRFPGWNGLRVTAPAGDKRVHLQWDNLSELTADPIQGKVLFGGYRIWRVEGWNRPIGSMGPSAEDWQLMADLALVPQDGLGPDSPSYLPKYVASDFDTNECVATGVCDWINTGADPRRFPDDVLRVSIPVGIYSYIDSLGLKNGMLYFYDVTAYSAWYDTVQTASGYEVRYRELESLPAAMESEGVTPRWTANRSGDADGVFVVPNPYIAGQNPAGWDLTPSDADPTGSHIAFASLPDKECEIRIYTLAGDLVQTIGHDRRHGSGTEFWNLVSRNGQEVTAGIYLYSVRCSGETHVGRFTIVR